MSIGDYTQQTLLGIGPYGKVYSGKDSIGRNVTIKVIHKEMISNEANLQQSLMEELEQLKLVEHPKVIKLLAVLMSEHNYYLIQEYHSGITLQEYIIQIFRLLNDKKKLNEDQVIQMIQDILETFMEFNKHGIMHRNLRPSNVIYDNNQFKLCDFGQSNIIETFKNKTIQFTSGDLYKSPQVLKNQYYTNQCDIWSIGVLVYHSLFGYTPWFATKQEELIYNIYHQPINFTHQLIEISRELQDFIVSCLQLDEKDRLNWDTIFNQPIIYAHFQHYQQQMQEDRLKFIMNHIRRTIMKEQIDLLQLFASIDSNNNKLLDFDEFSKLLRQLDSKISIQDIEYIFQKVDLDHSGEISFDEFVTWLTDNNVDVRMLSQRFQQNYADKQQQPAIEMIQSQMPQQQQYGDQQYLDNLLQQLRLYFNRMQINMLDLFNSYDQDKDHLLSLMEFQNLIQQLDRSIPSELIFQLFQRFSNDQFITFIQFRLLLQIHQQQQFQNIQQNQIQQYGVLVLIEQFKQQIKNINHMDLFTLYDQNKDHLLQYQEFNTMIKAYLPNLPQNMVLEMFNHFELGSDIGFIRFRQLLQ